MARNDDETPWTRELLVGVGALVVVALVIGGIVGVVALGAAKVSGLGSSRPRATEQPSLYVPSGDPTVGLEQYPDPSGGAGSSASPSSSPSPTKRSRAPRTLTLQAFPLEVSAGQRINLTGLYRGGEGVRLQVQRFDAGRWTAFPVNPTVTGGQFATYVTTARSGPQRFRVVDPVAQQQSNPVTVTVG